MLLRAVAGLILPTTGSVSVNGKAITQHNRFNDSVGIVIEQTELWPHLTALETLQYINSFNQKATQEEIIHWLEKVGLEPNSRKLVKAFSLGMKQKLALAQAFFFEPDLILLDEPTNALDEQSRLRIYNILDEFKQKGKTIIIASHIKEDLAICERVVEIDAGSLKIL
jgi:ABC-2 type transport system ATP-binding protein